MEQLGRGDAKAAAWPLPWGLGRVFSQYRSIYSLEIKDLQSTGHLAVAWRNGCWGGGDVDLALPFFPSRGLPSDDWSDRRQEKKYLQSTILGLLGLSQPRFESCHLLAV